MNTFIDILSRLIIATITFVAPMIVFCFGIFYEALKLTYKERETKQKEMAEEAYSQMSNPEVDKLQVLKSVKKKINIWYEPILDFVFNPKVQILFIFVFLIISLCSLMFSHLVKDNIWKMSNYIFWKFLIYISLFSYLLSVITIFSFVRNIILMKEKIEKNKS